MGQGIIGNDASFSDLITELFGVSHMETRLRGRRVVMSIDMGVRLTRDEKPSSTISGL